MNLNKEQKETILHLVDSHLNNWKTGFNTSLLCEIREAINYSLCCKKEILEKEDIVNRLDEIIKNLSRGKISECNAIDSILSFIPTEIENNDCKINVLVTYEIWQDSGSAYFDDYKVTRNKILQVENLEDLNEMFTNLIDIKILK